MRKLIFIIILLNFKLSFAQDPIFTQFFVIPETVNTGFTGAYGNTKAGIIHRVQWPKLNFSINTQFAYVDNWFEELNSGLGISILNHKETHTRYNLTQFNLNYAYEVQITDRFYFMPSISIGMGGKDFGFQNILLEDQINPFSGLISNTTIDPSIVQDNITYFDFSSSLLFMYDRSWFGLTIKHLNRPNISLLYQGNVPLDMFMSLHGSLELPIFNSNDDKGLFVVFNGMRQSEYNRLDFGAHYQQDWFTFGLLAATNPIKNNPESHFLTSINAIAGIAWENFRFGYSYSFNMSDIGRDGGVYELSVSWQGGDKSNCFGCPKYPK
tara:strand:- start:4549 stop:5523 length:975 start_codon:yes stop_codon:yes gene_type:complete